MRNPMNADETAPVFASDDPAVFGDLSRLHIGPEGLIS